MKSMRVPDLNWPCLNRSPSNSRSSHLIEIGMGSKMQETIFYSSKRTDKFLIMISTRRVTFNRSLSKAIKICKNGQKHLIRSWMRLSWIQMQRAAQLRAYEREYLCDWAEPVTDCLCTAGVEEIRTVFRWTKNMESKMILVKIIWLKIRQITWKGK